jgi:hypothetical protein
VANLLVSDPAREREGSRTSGLTEFELYQRTGIEPWLLRRVLNEEQARQRVRLDPATGVYSLAVDAFDSETFAAFVELELV